MQKPSILQAKIGITVHRVMESSILMVNYLRALVELFWMQYDEKVIVEGALYFRFCDFAKLDAKTINFASKNHDFAKMVRSQFSG